MVKRKRGDDSLSIRHLQKFQDDLARALKAAKGHERQRMAKRQRTVGGDAEQKQKLDREISVLKSLDLHQTARAHLYSSLLRIKRIADHQDLPELVKRGVAKPDLPEDERAVLHKVTSGLYNNIAVKRVVGKAVASVCEALGIPVPEKGKGRRKDTTEEPAPEAASRPDNSRASAEDDDGDGDDDDDEESEFEGFSADNDDDEDDENAQAAEDLDSEKEVRRENDFDAMDGLLGSSSDSDSEEDQERARLWDKYRGKETVNLDDISVSGGDSDADDAENNTDHEDDEDENPAKSTTKGKKTTSRGLSLSPSPSPPPRRKRSKVDRTAGRPGESTFLPSLMGGYVSGSESASDVDVAPPKKRRGQLARRAIWEQKYGSKAKHIQDGANGKGRRGKGRDDGWDMKRGAVDGDDGRTPWKKGVKNPFSGGAGGDADGGRESRRPQQPTKRDDEGTLHPSWEARKKAKESQKAVTFAGSKVVFD